MNEAQLWLSIISVAEGFFEGLLKALRTLFKGPTTTKVTKISLWLGWDIQTQEQKLI